VVQDGTTFEVMGPGKRAWEGDEDVLLTKLANSLAVRIAAAAQEERPTELSSVEVVRQQLRARGTYNTADPGPGAPGRCRANQRTTVYSHER
jgi:hypothetical protein